MIESEPRGLSRRELEETVPEVRHHQQHEPQGEHRNSTSHTENHPQSQDIQRVLQQQLQRLNIRSDNSDTRDTHGGYRPSRIESPSQRDFAATSPFHQDPEDEEEDAGGIRVSVTTTTTVSDAAPAAVPAPAQRGGRVTTTTPAAPAFDINRDFPQRRIPNFFLDLSGINSSNFITDTATAIPTYANSNMGLAYNVYLNSGKIYGCRNCKTHLANHEDIISRNFRGQHGKAYLFNSVVNVETGDAGERNMTTGRHVVRDIFCRQCKEVVGWKYDKAYEPSEKYKEGKFILEAELLANVN